MYKNISKCFSEFPFSFSLLGEGFSFVLCVQTERLADTLSRRMRKVTESWLVHAGRRESSVSPLAVMFLTALQFSAQADFEQMRLRSDLLRAV